MTVQAVSPSVYYRVFTTLVLLTILTVGVAFIDLGPANVVVAIGIAVAKALLVALFFMHLKYESRLTGLFAIGGAIWLVILLTLTVGDTLARAWLPGPTGW